ncbi:Vgb family protein [Phormidesmis priestleyi]
MSKSFPLLKRSIVLISSLLSLLAARADAALLVGNTRGNNVVIYGDAGNFGGDFIAPGAGGLLDPDDLTFGPDGNLYVSSGSGSSGKILRYNGKTGDFIDEFASTNLIRPYGNAFGPDGNLYVSSFLTDQILRFDGKTGAFINVFAAATGTRESGKLNGPNDLLFTPDGRLLVTTQGSVAIPDPDKPGSFKADFPGFESQVLSYDLKTGESKVFISQPTPSPDSFGFVSFLGLAIGPQGDLFVSDFANDIRRYDLNTGGFKEAISTNYTGVIPSSSFIGNLTFDPTGNLYTVGFDQTTNNGAILRYDSNGEPLPSVGNSSSIFVATNGNLKRPIGITYADIKVPEPGAIVGLAAVSLLGVSILKRRKSAID